jgi:hypothetical protein
LVVIIIRWLSLGILAPYPALRKRDASPDFDVAPQQKASHIAATSRKSHAAEALPGNAQSRNLMNW